MLITDDHASLSSALSATPPLQPTKPQTSLTSLPYDLKRYVAAAVDAIDCAGDDQSKDDGPAPPRNRKTVAALRLAGGRDWAEVLEEYVWKDISLDNRDFTSLFHLLRDVLPSKTRYLRSLRWHRPAHEPGPDGQALSEADARTVPALLAAVIAASPRLEDARLDILRAFPSKLYPVNSAPPPLRIMAGSAPLPHPVSPSVQTRINGSWTTTWARGCIAVYDALEIPARAGKLKRLAVDCRLGRDPLLPALLDLYQACREGGLEELSVTPLFGSYGWREGHPLTRTADYRAFLTSLFDFPSLASLSLKQILLPNYVATIPCRWERLTRLSLEFTAPEDPNVFLLLLDRVAGQLTHLSLVDTPGPSFYAAFPTPPSPDSPFFRDSPGVIQLPRLENLTVGANGSEGGSILPYLALSPFAYPLPPSSAADSASPTLLPLTLSIPHLSTASLPVLTAFLTSHLPRLSLPDAVVRIHPTTISTDAQAAEQLPDWRFEMAGNRETEEVKAWCEERGVRAEVV